MDSILSTTIVPENARSDYNVLGTGSFYLKDVDEFLARVMLLIRIKEFTLKEVPILIEFYNLRIDSTALGKALKYKFGGGNENPYRTALDNKKISQRDYELYMAKVDLYCSMWNLINEGWHYIKAELEKNYSDDYPKTDVAYFFAILQDFYQEKIDKFFNGFKASVQDVEDYSKLNKENFEIAARINLKGNSNKEQDMQKFQENNTKLKKYEAQFGLGNKLWFSLAIDILTNKFEDDERIRESLTNFYKKGQSLHDLARLDLQQRRKNKQVSSEKWVNGKPYVGIKGGSKESTSRVIPILNTEIDYAFVTECFKNGKN